MEIYYKKDAEALYFVKCSYFPKEKNGIITHHSFIVRGDIEYKDNIKDTKTGDMEKRTLLSPINATYPSESTSKSQAEGFIWASIERQIGEAEKVPESKAKTIKERWKNKK